QRDGLARVEVGVAGTAAFARQDGCVGRDATNRVVDDEREILVEQIGVIRDAVGVDVGGGDGDVEGAGDAGRQENALDVVAQVVGAARRRECAGENVAPVRLATDGHGEIEVVVVRVAGGR